MSSPLPLQPEASDLKSVATETTEVHKESNLPMTPEFAVAQSRIKLFSLVLLALVGSGLILALVWFKLQGTTQSLNPPQATPSPFAAAVTATPHPYDSSQVTIIPNSSDATTKVTNYAHAYSVTLPKNLYIWTEEAPDTIGFWLEPSDGEATGVWIHAYDNPTNVPARTWWETNLKAQSPALYQKVVANSQVAEALVAGLPAYYVDTALGSTEYQDSMIISHEGRTYVISTNLPESDRTVFDQVLGGLSFLVESPQRTTQQTSKYTHQTLGFSFNLPAGYTVLKETPTSVELGFDNFSYLVITSTNITDPRTLPTQDNCPMAEIEYECLSNHFNSTQVEPILSTQVGKVAAESYYIFCGPDCDYHLVRTTDAPQLQFKMYVAGANLDQVFQDILNSVTFIKTS